MTDAKLFSGNANKALAEKIAAKLGTKLGKMEVTHFSDGEVFVTLNETVRNCDVFLIQPPCGPVNDNLMELLVMIDACRRASAGSITVVIPYFGYARQERKSRPRDPITAKLVANMITTAGADRVITMDLHAAAIEGFFDIPVDNFLGGVLFTKYFTDKFGYGNPDVMVVSPDVGSVARARKFAQTLGVGMAIVDKRREKANQSEVMNIIGDVKGKRIVIFDDMVDTAGSLCGAAKAMVEVGGATEVYACATHGVLSGPAISRINDSVIKELVLVDTIPAPEVVSEKITYVTSCEMFAEAISCVLDGSSMEKIDG
jgi:ribose-phosphate pyrophosphokinase